MSYDHYKLEVPSYYEYDDNDTTDDKDYLDVEEEAHRNIERALTLLTEVKPALNPKLTQILEKGMTQLHRVSDALENSIVEAQS